MKILSVLLNSKKDSNHIKRAFSSLADLLEQKFSIDAQYNRKYDELLRDQTFWQSKDKKPNAVIFIRRLRRIGERHWDYADWESRHQEMEAEELDAIDESLEGLSSTLCREKYYKHVLSDLGLPNRDFSLVNLADAKTDGFLETLAGDIEGKNIYKWHTLAHWELKINEALDIVKRMLGNAPYIFSYTPEKIKRQFRELIVVLGFGLFLPLIILGFQIPPNVSCYLTYISLAGFSTSFIVVIINIQRETTSTKITTLD